MDVRYTGMPSQQFPRGVAATLVVSESRSDCAVAEDHILNPVMIGYLAEVGTDIARRLRWRPIPTPKPWGVTRLIPTDLPLHKYPDWKITESGIYVPIPRGLMTEKLRISLQAAGTAALRYFRPID